MMQQSPEVNRSTSTRALVGWGARCIAACFLLTTLFLFFAPDQQLPAQDPVILAVDTDQSPDGAQQPSDCPRWDANQRVAWVVPFLSAPTMPPYAAFCLRSVAASSPYLHLYLAYENATMVLPDVQADNIHYVSLKEGEVVDRLLAVLKEGLGQHVVDERAQKSVRSLLRLNPRKVGVYKPLFGAAFQDIIGNYSHWAWGDIDTLLGDVSRLVSSDDLRQFDIMSFNNGAGLLYLQGQLTILANRPEINEAWKKVENAESLATSRPAFAWEETSFSKWALYSSTLHIKLMPLQFSGKDAGRWDARDDRVLIWDNGRLLLHSNREPEAVPLLERLEAPLLYQDTWTSTPQRPGPHVLERLGSASKSVWYGSRREAQGYDRRTEEFILFHYNYEHEANVPNALAKKNPDEARAVLNGSRITWSYLPFDFTTPPPCGASGGGNCLLESGQQI